MRLNTLTYFKLFLLKFIEPYKYISLLILIACFLFFKLSHAQSFTQLNQNVSQQLLSNNGLQKAIAANGGYLYNCNKNGSIWGWLQYCYGAEHKSIDLKGGAHYYLKDFNYSMNSDWPTKNSLTLKITDQTKRDFLLGSSAASIKNGTTTDLYDRADINGQKGSVYIGNYSGGNTTFGQKLMTHFTLDNINDLYFGGSMYFGGYYSMFDVSTWGGGGANVTFNVQNNTYSNANIHLTQCAHNNCAKELTVLKLKGKNFYSSGDIVLGYIKDGHAYYSKAAMLDLSEVENSYIKKIVASAQYDKDNSYSGIHKNIVKAKNLIIDTVQLKWNGADLTINSTNNSNRSNTDENGWAKDYKQESESILKNFDKSLNLDSKKFVIVKNLSNSTTGKLNSGVSATLKTNNDILIDKIFHNNAAGGQNLTVDANSKHTYPTNGSSTTTDEKKDIVVREIFYKNTGLYGSSSTVTLVGKNIFVERIGGGENSCSGVAQAPWDCGIGNLNKFVANGDSFYANYIQAIGAPTVGGNSSVILSGIKNSTTLNKGSNGIFINTLELRTATFDATSFAIDLLNVSKGNSYSTINFKDSTNNNTTNNNLFVGYIDKFNLFKGTSSADKTKVAFNESTNGNGTKVLIVNKLTADSWAEVDAKNLDLIYIQNAGLNYLTFKGKNIIFEDLGILDDKSSIEANSINVTGKLHLINTLVTKTPKVTIKLNGVNGTTNNSINLVSLNNKDQKFSFSGKEIALQDLGGVPTLRNGVLNNYGSIILDGASLKSKENTQGAGAELIIEGNLHNFNNIEIGAGSKIVLNNNFLNFGNLEFTMDKQVGGSEIKVGSVEVKGSAVIDISPGARQLLNVNIPNILNLDQTVVGKEYTLVTLNNTNNGNSTNSFIYTYSLGGITTIISKNKTYNLKTDNKLENTFIDALQTAIKENGTSTTNNNTQKTAFELANISNPWDDPKAKLDDNNMPIEKDLGLRKSLNTKECQNDSSGVCINSNNTNSNAYEYAKSKAKNSISFKSDGSDLIGKYLKVEKSVQDSKISFKILMLDNSNFNPNGEKAYCSANSSTFDCLLYTEAGNSNEWIKRIKNESVNSYEILKALFYNPQTQLKFIKSIDQSLANSRNIEYFLEVGKTLDNSLRHISDLFFKESSLNQTLSSSFNSRLDRLVKLSSVYNKDFSSLRYALLKKDNLSSVILENLENKKFASNEDILFSSLQDMIQNYSQRSSYPHNLWINLMGNSNFNDTGTALVYGFNSGYDYFINNTAIGVFLGYGRGSFNGKESSFLSNNSDNITAGFYLRSFIDDNELDFNISYGFGLVNERLQNSIIRDTKNILNDLQINNVDNLLTVFNQKYNYVVSNLQANFTYGKAFIMKKGYILKPQIGITYEIANGSRVTGNRLDINNFLGVSTQENFKNSIALNAGIEARKYYKNGSYIFILGNIKQDIFILKNSVQGSHNFVNIIGLNPINSPNPNALYSLGYIANVYNSIASINTGGEIAFNKFFINGGMSVSTSLLTKSFGIGLQIGARLIF